MLVLALTFFSPKNRVQWLKTSNLLFQIILKLARPMMRVKYLGIIYVLNLYFKKRMLMPSNAHPRLCPCLCETTQMAKY